MPEGENGYNLGVLKGQLKFEFGKEDQQKLDQMKDDASMFEQLFDKFDKGAGAKLGALAAGASAVMASQGFSSLLKTLMDVLGFLSDLMFITLLPVIRPLFDLLRDVGDIFQDMMNAEGGLWTAILNPTFLGRLALAFVEAILDMTTGLVKIGTKILDAFIAMLNGNNTFKGQFAKLGKQWEEVKSSFKAMWKEGSDFFNSLITFFKEIWKDLDDSGVIEGAFGFLWDLMGVGVDVLSIVLGGLTAVLLDPDLWIGLGKLLIFGMAALGGALVVIGRNIAEGLIEELKALATGQAAPELPEPDTNVSESLREAEGISTRASESTTSAWSGG